MVVIGNAYGIAQLGQISLEIDNTTWKSAETLKSLGLTIDCILN